MDQVSPTEAGIAHEPEEETRAAVLSGAGVRYAYLLAGAGLIGLAFCWLQFSTPAICCGDLDGYYHIRWSQTLWQSLRAGHFPPRFTWLPLTTLNARDYVDHHLLFHIIEIPFTFFRDLRLGAKVSAALFGSLALFSCYWLVWRYRIRYPLVWLFALLASSAPFLYRMNMTKAMSLSLVLLVGGIYLLLQRKYLWLLPLAFVFTEAYDMFVLLWLIVVPAWTAVTLWSERRFEWRPLVWTTLGVALGTIINPYFPHNVGLLYEHAVMKVFVADQNRPRVGNEWYPYETWDFFRNSLVACAAMVAGYIAFAWEDRKRAARPLFFLIFSTVLLVANVKWRRFAEYWPPVAVLFAAFAVQAALERVRASYGRLPADVQDELQPYLDTHAPPVAPVAARSGEDWGLIAATVATLALATAAGFVIYGETKEIKQSAPPGEYRAGIEWLRTHVPAGEVVFNTDWDDFPKLFYYDPTHAYITGLDPSYLYDASPELSKLYEQITLGKEADPGPLIRDRFGARYVFTDNEDVHNDFYDAAMDSGWFEEVYADADCTILHVRDQKGAPPPDTNEGNSPDDDDSNTEDNAPGDNETLNLRPGSGGNVA